MAEAILCRMHQVISGSGSTMGGGWNFVVTAVLDEPTSPKENTLWVVTDAEMTKCVLDYTEPTDPVEGMVWIDIDTESNGAFNAVEGENEFMIYPIGCKQYTDGAWVTRGLNLYQNGAWIEIVRDPLSFPEEPTSYSLIGTYRSSSTYTIPEDGWFQIEVFGASGNGGYSAWYNASSDYLCSGGGGGGGGYARSHIKAYENDTLTLVCGAVGSTSSVTINNTTTETYSTMRVTSGSNGGNATADSAATSTAGTGGTGGTASGGNKQNANGGMGSAGYVNNNGYSVTGGAGGSAGYTGGNAGGRGGGVTYGDGGTSKISSPETGSAGFIKIYRGNTNL